MKQLIVTADDFGMSDGVCAGIVEAMERGIVTQTSAMVCREEDAARVRQWAVRVAGRIGVHLQITDGNCVSAPEDVPSLIDEHGAFPRGRAGLKRPRREEVEREWRAQWVRARTIFAPTHVDSHHHVHMSIALLPAMAAVAREANLPGRSGAQSHARLLRRHQVVCPDLCDIAFYRDGLTEEHFAHIVDAAFASIGGSGTVEVMTHPARADNELAARSHYVAERETELAILTAPSLRARLDAQGIRLISMAALAR
jgi:chitin disaccharide deacetylase